MADDTPPDLLIQHAPRKKLAETVAQQILEAVRDLPPGTRLPPERELTKRMSVGRSTVREALNGLAMMGVVEIRHGQGVFVAEQPSIAAGAAERSLPPREVTDELLEARRIVEVELVRLAAERRTEEDLTAMQTLLDRHRADLEAGRGPIMQASQFHLLVADAAKNQILADVVRPFFRLDARAWPAALRDDRRLCAMGAGPAPAHLRCDPIGRRLSSRVCACWNTSRAWATTTKRPRQPTETTRTSYGRIASCSSLPTRIRCSSGVRFAITTDPPPRSRPPVAAARESRPPASDRGAPS